MFGAIGYGQVEYGGLKSGGNSPRFSLAGKPISADFVKAEYVGTMNKEVEIGNIGQ